MDLTIIRKLIYKLPISPALQEMVLEILRLAFSAVASALVVFVTIFLGELLGYAKEQANSEVWVMILTLAIRSWDKYKYENNKDKRVESVDNTGAIGF